MKPEEIIQEGLKPLIIGVNWAIKYSYKNLLAGAKLGCNICNVLLQELFDAVEQPVKEITE